MANHLDYITQGMNDVTLDDKDEGGIALEELEGHGNESLEGDATNHGSAMEARQRSVYQALEANLFLFQFYHEIDVNRVVDGSPWSFNRKVLLIARMQEAVNPRCIPLNKIDLWVQIHDLQPGFMSEKVIMEVGNQIVTYVRSCPNNYKGVWREYMRIRVTLDIARPLKRRMKVRKSGNKWSWITLKYENVPTFCFICGVLGHSDKFCSKLFEVPENEISRPYGAWMRAPLRRAKMAIGSKWLRNGMDHSSFKETVVSGASGSNSMATGRTEKSVPKNTRGDEDELQNRDMTSGNKRTGMISGISNKDNIADGGEIPKGPRSVILENKKRRTDTGNENEMGPKTEIDHESDSEEAICFFGQTEVRVAVDHCWFCGQIDLLLFYPGSDIAAFHHSGQGGGIALLWRNKVEVELQSYSNNHVDVIVTVPRCSQFWLTGDMNNVLGQNDKRGGPPYPSWLIRGFQQALDDCELHDMELQGYQFT
ncbi:hypothetical protein AgCh_040108 [Apium graveolens]